MGRCAVVSYWNSTSNHNISTTTAFALELYLIEILHQTTTFTPASFILNSCILLKFYIKPQLWRFCSWFWYCCILLKFYIKPQLYDASGAVDEVVSYWNSTSNHNLLTNVLLTTTGCILLKFYIKPQLCPDIHRQCGSCILLKFYIKPQPVLLERFCSCVVSYWNSTSNHNSDTHIPTKQGVVSYWNSTSNHNS